MDRHQVGQSLQSLYQYWILSLESHKVIHHHQHTILVRPAHLTQFWSILDSLLHKICKIKIKIFIELRAWLARTPILHCALHHLSISDSAFIFNVLFSLIFNLYININRLLRLQREIQNWKKNQQVKTGGRHQRFSESYIKTQVRFSNKRCARELM